MILGRLDAVIPRHVGMGRGGSMSQPCAVLFKILNSLFKIMNRAGQALGPTHSLHYLHATSAGASVFPFRLKDYYMFSFIKWVDNALL